MNFKRFSLLTALVAVLAASMLVAAASASAAVRWQVDSVHGPQNMSPGGSGQYVISAFNIGDEDAEGSVVPIEVLDELPAGLTATAAQGEGWSCSGVGTATVSCESAALVPHAATDLDGRGDAHPVFLTVAVSETASSAENVVTVSGGGAPGPATAHDPTPISSTPAGFGFVPGSYESDLFDAAAPDGGPVRQAGSHPFEMRLDFKMNLALRTVPASGAPFTDPDQYMKTNEVRLPAGVVGNPEATPKCDAEQLGDSGPSQHGLCPANSQVGSIDLALNTGTGLVPGGVLDIPVFNMVPPPGHPAAFGFAFLGNPVYIVASLDPHDYSVITRIENINTLYPVRSARLSLWGVPADPAHEMLRTNPDAAHSTTAYGAPSTAEIKPFLTLPSQCDTGGRVKLRADSWLHPGQFTPWQEGEEIKATGCEDPRIRFRPRITIQPTSHEAAAPTGLNVDLSVPQKNDSFASGSQAANEANAAKLYAPNGNDAAIVTPNLKDAVTHLPAGMAVNPSAADGLSGCSEEQVGLGNNNDPACPDSSKIGTVEIESPLIADNMHGFVYQAKQFENPSHSLLGFYTVAQGDGLTIKLAAEVKADPQTGELTTVFNNNPQLAFSHYRLHFWGGQRAPLVNPPACGEYQGSGTFTAWNSSVPPVTSTDTTHITSGPNGAPCPSGALDARFQAGSSLPLAGAFSPFALEVSRAEDSQKLATIETSLPAGTLAKLAGVPYCSEATLATIPTAVGSGVGERESPSCPAASLVGHLDAGAGAGLPFHNRGNVYLAGPYKGAPLSLAIVTPVVGGPLDLGNVVTRVAMYVDPVTAQVHAVSDPLPTMIAGIPLNLRSVRVDIDRPQFTLNPTSCEPTAVTGRIGGLAGATADVSDRFQVGGCAALDFKPKLSLRLKGQTHRAGHPALTATLTMPAGGANIAKAAVTLPHSEFLAQSHIGSSCTRVQYAAGGGGGAGCPANTVYGKAVAYSPLLDQPLEGKVYLRSNGGERELPDLVASLGGQIHIDLVGYVDSKNGGIRTTFATAPDAPVSKFVLKMPGGRKGLLENHVDICRGKHRATASFDAHNGRVADIRPLLRVSCRKGGR